MIDICSSKIKIVHSFSTRIFKARSHARKEFEQLVFRTTKKFSQTQKIKPDSRSQFSKTRSNEIPTINITHVPFHYCHFIKAPSYLYLISNLDNHIVNYIRHLYNYNVSCIRYIFRFILYFMIISALFIIQKRIKSYPV